MKKLITLVLTLCLGFGAYAADDLKLWYDRPADYWVEALPLGNGHLGAMVYGGVAQDTKHKPREIRGGSTPLDGKHHG